MKKLFFFLLTLCLGAIETYAQALRTFYIDFGPNDVTNGHITTSPDVNGNYWNNVININTTAPPVNLVDKANAPTR